MLKAAITTSSDVDRPVPVELVRAEAHHREETTVVSLSGELHLANAEKVARQLRALLGRRPRQVAIDLAELEFMDLAGMRAVLRFAEEAGHRGIGVSLDPGGGGPRRLLELCGALERFALVGGINHQLRNGSGSRCAGQ